MSDDAADVERRKQLALDVDARLASALSRAREASGLTVSAVARRLAQHETQVWRYMRGESTPSLGWVTLFAEAVDMPVEAVLGDAGLLPKVGVSDAIKGDPGLAAVYKKLLQQTYVEAVKLSKEMGL